VKHTKASQENALHGLNRSQNSHGRSMRFRCPAAILILRSAAL
jgi:hypothetical protein